MRWTPILLAACLLTTLLAFAPSASATCYGVHQDGRDIATACYDENLCLQGTFGNLHWEANTLCGVSDPVADPPCYGVVTKTGLTGYCQVQNCQYWYVAGKYVERTCWI